jgi:formate hydrogenlyase subunit 6/NADH:ubiquinone oxidoreductase subunit I
MAIKSKIYYKLKKKQGYFQDLWSGISTSLTGLRLSIRHLLVAYKRRSTLSVIQTNYFELQNGLVTLQYPTESYPVPDNGRYRLHNEMDDCIVCDKCAKVCPVDCIDIEPIKATEQIGTASDGSPIRLYAAKFDIDMAKCCFCGLCTTVCPTECLTMTKVYDYSETDIHDMNYEFSNLSPEQAEEKKKLLIQFQLEKEALKQIKPPIEDTTQIVTKSKFVPKIKSVAPKTEDAKPTEDTPAESKPKPKFVPKIKSVVPKTEDETPVEDKPLENKPKPKFIPKIKPPTKDNK